MIGWVALVACHSTSPAKWSEPTTTPSPAPTTLAAPKPTPAPTPTPTSTGPCEPWDYSGTVVDGLCYTDEPIEAWCAGQGYPCPTFDEYLAVNYWVVDYGEVFRCVGEATTGADFDVVDYDSGVGHTGSTAHLVWFFAVASPLVAHEQSWTLDDDAFGSECCGGEWVYAHRVHWGPALSLQCNSRIPYGTTTDSGP